MALRFIDGFDYYSSYAELLLKYEAVYGTSSYFVLYPTEGRRGNGCLEMYSASNYIRKNFDDQETWVIGFALKSTSMPTGTNNLVVLRDSYGNVQTTISITSTGTIVAYRGGSTILGTSVASIVSGAWTYFEVKERIHDTLGSIVVRLDEVEVLNLSNIDTKASSYAGARSVDVYGGVGTRFRYDDFYILDGTGTTNNDFLGDVRVDALHPSGAGTNTDFTPVGGTDNWDNVNDPTLDSDSTYNTSATAGATDTFSCSDLTAATGDIFAVQANLVSRKDDAGTGSMKPVVLLSSTVYEGEELISSDSYYSQKSIWETNPATSAAWADTEINGAEFGYRISA